MPSASLQLGSPPATFSIRSKISRPFCATLTDATRIGEAIAAGADEYVMKPFDGAILGSKLALLGALGGTEAPSLA